MTDAEILQLVAEGRYHPATKRLYSHYPLVRKHILANSGSREEAEDIFQDALLVLFSKVKAGNFELRTGLPAYLFGVARLLWLEELRRKEKRSAIEKLAKEEADHTFPEIDLQEEQKAKRARQAVEQLGEKCRQLLEQFYFRKLSMKEIAKNLGFGSERVAKNQKYRCIEKAKAFLRTT